MSEKGNCNLALLSILTLDELYTAGVDSFYRIANDELPSGGGLNPQSIFGKCVLALRQPSGGFRQLRKYLPSEI